MKPIDNITRHSETSEKEIEKYLNRRAAACGWLSLKYYNANEAGYPDRLLLLPGGRCAWVEVKSRGKKPTALQYLRIDALRSFGHTVVVVDSRAAVDAFIESLYNARPDADL